MLQESAAHTMIVAVMTTPGYMFRLCQYALNPYTSWGCNPHAGASILLAEGVDQLQIQILQVADTMH